MAEYNTASARLAKIARGGRGRPDRARSPPRRLLLRLSQWQRMRQNE